MRAQAFVSRLCVLIFSVCCMGAGKPAVPEATPDFAVTPAGQSVLVNVLSNDVAVGPSRRILKVFKPGYGKTAIENGAVRYTPASGFVGSDQFEYMVQSEGSQPRLGSVNVEVGGGGVSLRLHGRVIDDEIPYATVQALVAGFTFLSVSDGHGNYVLDIAAPRGTDFLTLKATGVSATGSPVNFVSLVGEVAPLDVAAGSDGILTLDENNQVNLTHFSTAQYVLLTAANGGVAPSTDASLENLAQHIDLAQLVEYATIIKLVVDGYGGVSYPLPTGVNSVIELLQSPTQLAAFEATIPPATLIAARAAVNEDTAALSGFADLPIPARYAMIFPSMPGTIAVAQSGQSFLDLPPSAAGATSGRGEWLFLQFASDPGVDWALEGQRIRVVPDHVYTAPTTYPNPNCPENGPSLRVNGPVTALNLERLGIGDGVDYLATGTDQISESITPAGTNPQCALPPVGTVFSFTEPTLGFRDGAGEIPYQPGEQLGVQMLKVYRQYPSGAGNSGASLFDFDADSGAVPAFCSLAHHGAVIEPGGIGGEFCWQISGGHLLLEILGGDGLPYSYTYRRYQSDGRKGEGLLATIVRPSAANPGVMESVPIFGMASRQDGSLEFTPAMLPGRWASGLQTSLLPSQRPNAVVQHYDLCDNGLAEFENFNTSTGASAYTGRWSWSIEGGHFWMRSYVDETGAVARCDAANPACRLVRQREWVPVSADANRIYVIERRYESNGQGVALTTELPNFYERSELRAPGRCTDGSIPAH